MKQDVLGEMEQKVKQHDCSTHKQLPSPSLKQTQHETFVSTLGVTGRGSQSSFQSLFRGMLEEMGNVILWCQRLHRNGNDRVRSYTQR